MCVLLTSHVLGILSWHPFGKYLFRDGSIPAFAFNEWTEVYLCEIEALVRNVCWRLI